jgi:5'-nucleotidase/UDP-sugar diphosphatase
MKRFIGFLFSLTLVFCLSGTLLFAQGVKITLLHVNDTHSHLDAYGPKNHSLQGTIGGIAKAATIIKSVKSSEPNVLFLHGGDFFQGDPMFNTYFGVPELQILQQLGCDAMTLGNHELHFGPDILTSVLSNAFSSGSFPLLSANLDMSGYSALQPWIKPSIMKTIGGVKIGIFGLTIPQDPEYILGPLILNQDFPSIAAQNVQDLRNNGADVVVCMSHMGVYLDTMLAANVPGIDFIIGAHDHFLFKKPLAIVNPTGKTTYVFQAGSFYADIGKLHFTVNQGTVTINDYSMIPVDASVQPDPAIKAIVDNLKKGVVAKFGDLYGNVVAYAVTDLFKVYDERSPIRDTQMGDLVADAYRSATQTDIAITADGTISEQLYRGSIVGADIFRSLSDGYDEATGLGFMLATMDITGSELIKGMEIGLSQLGITDDYFLQYAGLRFKYDPTQPVGSRVIIPSIRINGAPINPSAKYSLTTNSGLAMLLGSLGLSVDNLQLLPKFEFNVVRDFLAARKVIFYEPQGRIIEEQHRACKDHDGCFEQHQKETDGLIIGNSPNPFNPSTVIRYQLPNSGFVHISVFNTLGEQVGTLVDEQLEKGNHEVVWNAMDKPSGLYFYKIVLKQENIAAISHVGKMMLIK